MPTMKRADRLRAITDHLRVRRTPVSVRHLAERFDVGTRTIERDLVALQDAGVPLYAEAGRNGGYRIAEGYSLPPIHFSRGELMALLAGLVATRTSPLSAEAETATNKLVGALGDMRHDEAFALSSGLFVLARDPQVDDTIRSTLATGLVDHRVIAIGYRDEQGNVTERDIEPLGLLLVPDGWMIVAWCRLRQAIRGFLSTRFTSATLCDEQFPERDRGELMADLERWPFLPSSLHQPR